MDKVDLDLILLLHFIRILKGIIYLSIKAQVTVDN